VITMKFIERENETLRIIEKLKNADLDFIVVGGHAVSGLARHRFSVDLDLVIREDQLKEFKKILEKEGYVKKVEKRGIDELYGGWFESYVKKINGLPVTVDLLVGSLVSRGTDASWSFNYLKENSTTANISGTELSVVGQVPERELLIAFKLHSMRRADIRDIIMLREGAEWEKILEHVERGNLKRLKDQISRAIAILEERTLVDSLKGVFSLGFDVSNQIKMTQKEMKKLVKRL